MEYDFVWLNLFGKVEFNLFVFNYIENLCFFGTVKSGIRV